MMASSSSRDPSPGSGDDSWLERRENGTLIRLLIQPKASRSEAVGLQAGATGEPTRLKVRIAAPPVDGAANEELLRFLKKAIKITGAKFALERGETSRHKDVFCEGVGIADARKLLP